MKDWRDSANYTFAGRLSREQWAWEFLRRNPDYRREWQAFLATWEALESAYGKPPQRDFNAWKRDPRAWVHAADCPAGECRVDQDKVLIECALGARWGFYKFPVDPNDDDPVGAGRLTWREVDTEEVIEVGLHDEAYLGTDAARIAIGFDLSLPLRPQMERAKRYLQMTQRQRVRDGRVRPASVALHRARWTRLLRLLDAEAAGADRATLGELAGDEPLVGALAAAHRLSDGGYRRLLRLPEA
jgi:hypothetical protein